MQMRKGFSFTTWTSMKSLLGGLYPSPLLILSESLSLSEEFDELNESEADSLALTG